MTNDDSFEPAVRQLFSIAKLDADQWLADSKLLFAKTIYKSIAIKSRLQRFNSHNDGVAAQQTLQALRSLDDFFTNTACNFFVMRASTQ